MTKTVSDLVDDLFRSHRKPNGREFSHVEVCVALNGEIEPSHLGKLRNGTIKNPKRDTLLALCRFFNVQPLYFFPELQNEGENEREREPEDPITTTMMRIQLHADAKKKLEEFLRSLQQR